MKITILGTGTSQGIPVISCQCETCQSIDIRDKRLRCAVLVEIDGVHIVIDTGPDFRQQMLACGNQLLHGVLITHEHNDHLMGLDDIRPYNFVQRQAISVYAQPRVVKDIRLKFAYAFNNPYPGAPKIVLNTIEHEKTFTINGVKIIPIDVLHNQLPILGYRIGNFAYITDASYIADEELLKLEGLSCLIINSLRPAPHPSHFNLEEALAFIKKVNPEKAYLTHISHLFPPQKKWKDSLPDNVTIAYDGLVISAI